MSSAAPPREPHDALIGLIEGTLPPDGVALVRDAYTFAQRMHEGQARKSGEPYIVHPYEVALILARLGADAPTIAAGLLHDVLEDTDVGEAALEERFGTHVVQLVAGVTKLGKLSFSSKRERQAENFRRMFLAMAQDIRVIVVKLADRLHNMRTLGPMAREKQVEIAQETLDIFSPLAHRLGMGKLKWELEDLSFRWLHPEEYGHITGLVAEKRDEREAKLREIVGQIEADLDTAGIRGKVLGRPKHFYSIWNKMTSQGKEFADLFDVTALRVIVDSLRECYHALGLVHTRWLPLPGRFKDYIAMPKGNRYQSLHTAVMGPHGAPFEVQIRTQEMHQVAEYGIAAHWRYKEGGSFSKSDEKLTWLRQFIDWQPDMHDADEFMSSVKDDLFSEEVFVFTPAGDVIDLMRGATCIDFAYRVHSSVGHRCTGARVNGRMVPLETRLRNGDIIEVLTGKVERPRLDWLAFAVTNTAKQRIRGWYKKQRREEMILLGRESLERELDRTRQAALAKPDSLADLCSRLKLGNPDDLLAAIGYGEKVTSAVAQQFRDAVAPRSEEIPRVPAKAAPIRSRGTGILVEGGGGMLLSVARCCSPVPGERIIGAVTKGKGISIHAEGCSNLDRVEPGRLVAVEWQSDPKATFPVHIAVEVMDRVGLLKDITIKIADIKTNIRNIDVRKARDRILVVHLTVDVVDLAHMERVLATIGRIADVIRAYRSNRGNASGGKRPA